MQEDPRYGPFAATSGLGRFEGRVVLHRRAGSGLGPSSVLQARFLAEEADARSCCFLVIIVVQLKRAPVSKTGRGWRSSPPGFGCFLGASG